MIDDRCECGLDEVLISGYLDRELPQAQAQKVRLKVESCESCRATYEQIAAVREAARGTRFKTPDPEAWSELPSGPASAWLRLGGGSIVAIWVVATFAWGLWHALAGAENLVEQVLIGGGVLGVGLVFTSVLIDRLKARPGDRYRGVHR